MWDEGKKEKGALIKSEPPCTLLYPQLSENLDRQTHEVVDHISIPLVILSG